MPIHDWTRVNAGIFHHFHHAWIEEISRTLNRALKGTDFYALAEQVTGDVGPDVLTLQRPLNGKKARKPADKHPQGGVALADAPPQVSFRITNVRGWYVAHKKAVTIRHVSDHRIVAVLEILSSGNKSSRAALDAFARRAYELPTAGVHLTLVDLFPPTRRDPEGIHPLIWGEDDDGDFSVNPTKPLTCASYVGRPGAEAFIEPVAVGDALPIMPVILTTADYVPVPLEETYRAAFEAVPDFWREELEKKHRPGKR